MSARKHATLAFGNIGDKKWFSGLGDDVDPDNDQELTEQRLEQWRPLSQNPFTDPGLDLMQQNYQVPTLVVSDDEDVDEKAVEKLETSCSNTAPGEQNRAPNPIQVTHAGPTWVNLFYDLAWTASFSSLTQNGQFESDWDSVSYTSFFLIMWWLWASQTLYSSHFYTNDWVHLGSTFIQLLIFGLLAATTHGFDVTTYIMHSPGTTKLESQTLDEMTDPKLYQADRVTSHSLIVIALSLAVSRTLLWLQHMLVLGYAFRTAYKRKLRIPVKLYVLPVGLFVSMGFFWAAAGLTLSEEGRKDLGAKLKFVLWGSGLIVEIVLHGLMEYLDWENTSFIHANEPALYHEVPLLPESLEALPQSLKLSPDQRNPAWPVPCSNVNIRDRLEGITTVILGEGLNGIAGTLYMVVSAPGLQGRSVAIDAICTGVIIYFLAYFYFEGPTGHRDPKGKPLRQMMWLLLHFPFLLGIILLLLGVKNQFLLTSYSVTASKTFGTFTNALLNDISIEPDHAGNLPLKNFLIKRGVTLADELKILNESLTRNGTILLGDEGEGISNDEIVGIWYLRILLKIMEHLYKTFMGGDAKIDPDVQLKIQDYYYNITGPLEDWNLTYNSTTPHYQSIMGDLLAVNTLGARFLMLFAGVILICLGVMNRVHSKPRDRFQWGIIISRVAMGVALLVLLIFNLSSTQSMWNDQDDFEANLSRWKWASLALPILATAFGIQALIEMILLRCAGLAIARKRGRVSGSLWRQFFRKPLSWSSPAK